MLFHRERDNGRKGSRMAVIEVSGQQQSGRCIFFFFCFPSPQQVAADGNGGPRDTVRAVVQCSVQCSVQRSAVDTGVFDGVG